MNDHETATLAGGCFWCTEAVFKRIKGVESVVPGYSGGITENPTYEQVVSGTTGHAETIQIKFDPKEISFKEILEIYFSTHDPTTLNRQGNDIGSQYRSAIFYQNETQKQTALDLKTKLEKDKVYKNPTVTEIIPFNNFFEAEDYHKNYFENHKNAPYCLFVINPKIKKLLQNHREVLKDEYK